MASALAADSLSACPKVTFDSRTQVNISPAYRKLSQIRLTVGARGAHISSHRPTGSDVQQLPPVPPWSSLAGTAGAADC